jgi:hypothetical protein
MVKRSGKVVEVAADKPAAEQAGPKQTDRPGRELPKEYREVADELSSNQGWRYDSGAKRGGHPILFPPDRTQPQLSVPTTPSDRRSFDNWLADVRRRGGLWPPRRERKVK